MTELLKKDLELVEVERDEKLPKATMTFLDAEAGEIREVSFNKNSYDPDSKKWIEDAEKAQKVEDWSQEYFGLTFDQLENAIGTKHDIYCYDKFNSLFPVKQVAKFKEEQSGQIFTTEITGIEDDGIKIAIFYEIDGETYQTKYTYAKYMEQTKQWFPNPNDKTKKLAKFKDVFNVPFEEKDSLIGRSIMVEVKSAFGKFYYGEIKKLPRN